MWLAVPGSGYGGGGTVKIKSKLTVAADAPYPPSEFIGPDGHTVVGMDPDLGHALGKVMGVNVNFLDCRPGMIVSHMLEDALVSHPRRQRQRATLIACPGSGSCSGWPFLPPFWPG